MVIISSAKISTKCPFLKSTFNQNTAKKGLRTLPNSVIDLFVRVLWNSCNRTSENIYKSIRSGALFYKNYTTDTFLVPITKEKKQKKKTLCIAAPFSLILNVCSPGISTLTRTGSKKNASWERSEILSRTYLLLKKALRIFLQGVWNSRKNKRFKQFHLFNIVLTTILKTDTTANASFEC